MIYHLNLPSEPISDQSDIESRIKALKEELRKRKFMAYQLKKEQKKRNKERLKAQEASLLKQLEVNVCLYIHSYIHIYIFDSKVTVQFDSQFLHKKKKKNLIFHF